MYIYIYIYIYMYIHICTYNIWCIYIYTYSYTCFLESCNLMSQYIVDVYTRPYDTESCLVAEAMELSQLEWTVRLKSSWIRVMSGYPISKGPKEQDQGGLYIYICVCIYIMVCMNSQCGQSSGSCTPVQIDVLVLPMRFAKPQFDLATIGRLAQCLVHAPTATRILP